VTSGSSAGFGRRFAALLYDSLLITALLMVYTAVAMLFTRGHSALLADTIGAWAYLYQAGLVLVIGAYFVFNWVHSGQTLGMRAWRLHAVDRDGQRLTVGPATRRFVCAVFAWIPAALGVLWLYVDRERLALHDRLSGTRILHVPAQLTGVKS
jgi:uncharacterized RDD family membrane protein YckC